MTFDVRNTTVTVRCWAVEPALSASSRNASSPRSSSDAGLEGGGGGGAGESDGRGARRTGCRRSRRAGAHGLPERRRRLGRRPPEDAAVATRRAGRRRSSAPPARGGPPPSPAPRRSAVRLVVVAHRVVVGHHPLEVDEQMVGGGRGLHLPTAADLPVRVVRGRRLALVRLLPLLLVRELLDAGQQGVQGALADRAARFRQGAVLARLGRGGRRAGVAAASSRPSPPPPSELPVQPASRAARSAATPGTYAFRCTVRLLSTVSLARLPVPSVPAGYSACRTGASPGDNVYRTHCRGRRSVVPYVDLGAGFAFETSVVFPGE